MSIDPNNPNERDLFGLEPEPMDAGEWVTAAVLVCVVVVLPIAAVAWWLA